MMAGPRFRARRPVPTPPAPDVKTAFAALLGAMLLAALAVWVGSGWPSGPEPFWGPRLFAAAAGNGVAALLVGSLLAARGARPAAGLAAGLLLGLAPFLTAWVPDWGRTVAFPLGALLAVLLARPLGRLSLLTAVPARAAFLGPLLLIAALVGAPLALPLADQPLPAAPGPPLEPVRRPPPRSRPDVVLIVADTLRADAVLDPAVSTPSLDALRKEGLWADYALAPSNQTRPSHLSFLTGLAPEKTGMRHNYDRWPTTTRLRTWWNCTPVAERFRRTGYRTVAVVSNPLLNPDEEQMRENRQRFDEGFEVWDGLETPDSWVVFQEWRRDHTWFGWLQDLFFLRQAGNRLLKELFLPADLRQFRHNYRKGEQTVARALGYLEELQRQPAPYFLFLHWMDPHSPYVPPPDYRGRHASPEAVPPGASWDVQESYDLLAELHRRQRRQAVDDPAARATARYLHGLYLEEVEYLDDLVGRVLERVRATGRPTLILFLSDHGEQFLEHGVVEHGSTLFQEEVAVPFILAGPGVPRGQHLEHPPRALDGILTLAALAGVDTRGMDGRNVLREPGPGPGGLTLMRGRMALERDGWRLVCRVEDPEDPEQGRHRITPEALYDLRADPGERRNVLPERQRLAGELLAELRRRLDRDDLHPHLEAREIPPREAARLADLGYVDG